MMIKQETEIMRKIMVECSDIAILWRANVGKFYTADCRLVNSGLPKGFSDLFGFRIKDCKIVFIEVKTPTGKPSAEQIQFLKTMQKYGCISGIARNTTDARNIIEEKRTENR